MEPLSSVLPALTNMAPTRPGHSQPIPFFSLCRLHPELTVTVSSLCLSSCLSGALGGVTRLFSFQVPAPPRVYLALIYKQASHAVTFAPEFTTRRLLSPPAATNSPLPGKVALSRPHLWVCLTSQRRPSVNSTFLRGTQETSILPPSLPLFLTAVFLSPGTTGHKPYLLHTPPPRLAQLLRGCGRQGEGGWQSR